MWTFTSPPDVTASMTTTSGMPSSIPSSWSTSILTPIHPHFWPGPDRVGNFIEVIVLGLADDQFLAIHAMPLRKTYYGLLPEGTND